MKRGRQVTEAASPATAQPRRRAPWAYPRSSARVGTPTSAQSWRTPLPQGLGPRARLERPQAPRRRWSWTPRAPGGPRAQGRRRLAAPRTVSEAASRRTVGEGRPASPGARRAASASRRRPAGGRLGGLAPGRGGGGARRSGREALRGRGARARAGGVLRGRRVREQRPRSGPAGRLLPARVASERPRVGTRPQAYGRCPRWAAGRKRAWARAAPARRSRVCAPSRRTEAESRGRVCQLGASSSRGSPLLSWPE